MTVGTGWLYRDNIRRWDRSRVGCVMRVPDAIRDCVACVERVTAGEASAYGTAFFVMMPSETLPNALHIYLVTAKHLLTGTGSLSLRFNRRDGSVGSQKLPNASQWHASLDKGVDVAALLLDDRFSWLDEVAFDAIPFEFLCTESLIAEWNIGIGDDLVVTGLLTDHPGTDRNVPVVRSGIISAVPGEPIRDRDRDGALGDQYRAFLVELRSTGGLSGSPVFVVIGPVRLATFDPKMPWREAMSGIGTISFPLLGLIHGHRAWPATDDRDRRGVDYDSDWDGVNRGIAKVIPADYISEILMSGKARAERTEHDRRRGPKSYDRLDAAPASIVFTRDDFMRELTKVTRPVEPPDQGGRCPRCFAKWNAGNSERVMVIEGGDKRGQEEMGVVEGVEVRESCWHNAREREEGRKVSGP